MLADNPRFIAELHPTKNKGLGFAPEALRAGSNRKVWWICAAGPDHEWDATPANRARGQGCPFCSGHRVSVMNALATLAPHVAEQWHPTKNGALTPRHITSNADRKVWWKCPKGPDHEWQMRVRERVGRGMGCPFCSSHRASVTNSLATKAPAIAAQWHPTKNGALTPNDVTYASEARVWWQCSTDPRHVWEAVVASRTRQKGRCAICIGKQVIYSSSFEARAPHLAAQWHPTKNGALLPSQVAPGSGLRVWWKCPEGPDHEWAANIGVRLVSPNCPFCTARRLSVTNSLANRCPKIAREWHPTKNGELTPKDVTIVSTKIVWWQCVSGHEFQRMIVHRTKVQESTCPHCVLHKRRPALTRKKRRYVLLASYEGDNAQ